MGHLLGVGGVDGYDAFGAPCALVFLDGPKLLRMKTLKIPTWILAALVQKLSYLPLRLF